MIPDAPPTPLNRSHWRQTGQNPETSDGHLRLAIAGPFSKIRMRVRPRIKSREAAASPAGPAPMMIASKSVMFCQKSYLCDLVCPGRIRIHGADRVRMLRSIKIALAVVAKAIHHNNQLGNKLCTDA